MVLETVVNLFRTVLTCWGQNTQKIELSNNQVEWWGFLGDGWGFHRIVVGFTRDNYPLENYSHVLGDKLL